MRDITHKPDTRRDARASAHVTMPPEIIELVRDRRVAKGDALEIARVAAVQAAKKTWDFIPFCHQIPITACAVTFTFVEDGIVVDVTATTIAPTGVEMEALTAAAVAALTLYDVLKPHSADVAIRAVELCSKTGGKSDRAGVDHPLRVSVLLVDAAGAAPRVRRWFRELTPYQAVVSAWPAQSEAGVPGWLAQQVDADSELLILLGPPGDAPSRGAIDALAQTLSEAWPGVADQFRSFAARRATAASLWPVHAGRVRGAAVLATEDHGLLTDDAIAALIPVLLSAVTEGT
jgi:molybdenum cofactor biosynthesis protein MoaC